LVVEIHSSCMIPVHKAIEQGHTIDNLSVYLQGLNLAAISAETDRRGFVPVSEQMEVLDKSGKPVSNVYCIGDANGESLMQAPGHQ
jgi:hypothetical protein